MKIQKILNLIVVLSLFNFNSYAQIILKIEVLAENKEEINIRFTSINTSSRDSLLFYTPSENSFCASLITIDLRQIETKELHEYFPCTEISDLNHVKLRKNNSVLILPKDSSSFEISLKKKNIHPYLRKGKYRVKASLNYENVDFKSEIGLQYPIYSSTVTSNEIEFCNK